MFGVKLPSQLSTAVASPIWKIAMSSQVNVKVSPLRKPAKRGLIGVITGAMVSLTVTVWLAVRVLPQASVAVQVRTIFFLLMHVESVVVVANVKRGDWSQASDTEGVPKVGTLPMQSTVTFAGMLVRIGAVLSWTVMVWIAVAILPQASVAVNVRVIV